MERRATAVWQGGLKDGKGTLSTESKALSATPYSFGTRFEGAPGTNPEELLGAAHAGCFSMALSMMLGEAGIRPERIETRATVTFEKLDSGFTITRGSGEIRGSRRQGQGRLSRQQGPEGGNLDGGAARRLTMPTPFHLAIRVRDLASARAFYGGLLGCSEGRSSPEWVDFDFFGHQLVCHVVAGAADGRDAHNPVDGRAVPIPHFGLVLEMPDWEALAARLRQAGVDFVIEPHVRFKGQTGEQATMFLTDPSGNALEFKSFRDIAGQMFAS
jgi:uncharacterized protein